MKTLKSLHTVHHYYDPDQKAVPEALLLRLSPGQLVRTSRGHRLREAGFYRQFELTIDLGEFRAPSASSAVAVTACGGAFEGDCGGGRAIDWRRLLAIAVLAHLRADMEVYFESGFRRVRRCQNAACRSWFGARPMGGRQRFCSTLCRVQHARAAGSRGAG